MCHSELARPDESARQVEESTFYQHRSLHSETSVGMTIKMILNCKYIHKIISTNLNFNYF